MYRVGIHYRYYSYATAVYGNGSPNADYITVPFIPFNKLKYKQGFLGNVKFFSPVPKVDFFHTMNNIVVNKKKWIITFESRLPRFFEPYFSDESIMSWAYEKLLSEYCTHILPMSNAAKFRFLNVAKRFGYRYKDFKNKVKIVYPGIKSPLQKFKREDDKVRLLFIGNDFFRKGGQVLVDSFLELFPEYPELELIIVSAMNANDYVTHADKKVKNEYIKIITNHPNIKLYSNVPHENISMSIIPSADINILTTFDDTFGYVIAEAMLAGLPNIVTNIFAIPEMVQDGVNGYLIELPVDEYNMIEIFYERDIVKKKRWVEEQGLLIKENLKKYISCLIEDEELREEMGRKGREKALANFDYRIRNKRLENIYKQCKD